MALTKNIELIETQEMIEYASDNRIRKKVLQSKGLISGLVCYEPGQGTDIHTHPVQDEFFYVIEGTGSITFGDRDDIPVKHGSVVFVPAGITHGISASTDDRLSIMLVKGPGKPGKAARNYMLASNPKIKMCTTAIEDLTPDIKKFVFKREDGGELPEFTAGAHVILQIGNGMRRCYSLAGDPADRSQYVAGILRDPNSTGGSEWIHNNLAVGDVLTAQGPLNYFPLAADAQQNILIGGGIGITPLLSMGYKLKADGANVHLHYCTKSAKTTAFKDEVEALFGDDVTFHHDGGDPTKGINLNEALEDRPEGGHLYMCGPAGLISEARKSASHWPEDSVHFEVFANIGNQEDDDDNVEFDIVLAKSEKKLKVPADETILDVLLDNDVNPKFQCTEGTCGHCSVDLLSGKADHRDHLPNDDNREAKVKICIARAMPGETLVLNI